MKRIVMIEKKDGYKYIVGVGKYPADSIMFEPKEGSEGSYVVTSEGGNRVTRVASSYVVAVETEDIDNSNKTYPSDY